MTRVRGRDFVNKPMDASILGRVGYDLYADEHHVPLRDVTRFSRYLGGSSANMAVGLSRLRPTAMFAEEPPR